VPSQIEVWQLDVAVDEVSLVDLSEDEGERCARYRQHADRARFAETRRALRSLLAGRLGISAAAVAFAQGQHGKPLLAGGALHFNVSHSGRYALIALSADTPVGIDLERIDHERPVLELAQRYFSPQEYAACRADPALFYRLWCCKEAVVKAWGSGLDDVLPAVQEGADGYAISLHGLARADTRAWRIAAPDGYEAALATA
jgi:4'-phosphopantetheinyl transferase